MHINNDCALTALFVRNILLCVIICFAQIDNGKGVLWLKYCGSARPDFSHNVPLHRLAISLLKLRTLQICAGHIDWSILSCDHRKFSLFTRVGGFRKLTYQCTFASEIYALFWYITWYSLAVRYVCSANALWSSFKDDYRRQRVKSPIWRPEPWWDNKYEPVDQTQKIHSSF